MEVGVLPGGAALDALPQVLLAGGDIAFKDLVQRDAAEAQADDLVGHLEEQGEVFRWLHFLLLILIDLLFPSLLVLPSPQLPPKTSPSAPTLPSFFITHSYFFPF